MLNEQQAARVKEFWEGTGGRWKTSEWEHWTQHPAVQQRCNTLVSGDPRKDRFQYFLERYYRGWFGRPRRAGRVLTLGCGYGEFERGLSQYKFARTHEGVDISTDAVREAERVAMAQGLRHLHYRAADLNTIELPRCVYDVVFGIMSIHHVSELERLFVQVILSLKPGGYFVLDEYVGPTKFQWTDNQLAAINDLLRSLPETLARSIRDGRLKDGVSRPTFDEMDAVDPSEAIRSGEILRLLPEFFDMVEIKGYGGTLLHMLLEGIAGNFAEDDPDAVKWLRSFFDAEDRLIASGELQNDFALIVARRKPTRVQKILGRRAAYLVTKARALGT
jgi:SAM-dependent methyltransferase